jgi:hypothetical protein
MRTSFRFIFFTVDAVLIWSAVAILRALCARVARFTPVSTLLAPGSRSAAGPQSSQSGR